MKPIELIAEIRMLPEVVQHYGPSATPGTFATRTISNAKANRRHWWDVLCTQLVGDNPDLIRDVLPAMAKHAESKGIRLTGSLLREMGKNPFYGNDEYTIRDAQMLLRDQRMSRKRAAQEVQPTNPFTVKKWQGQLMSVEVEYYGTRLKDNPFRKTGNDGSLSELPHGSEAKITAATTEGAIAKLRDLQKVAPVWGQKCGLHVHIDMRDATATQALATWRQLWRWKKVVRELVPISRLENEYCKWTMRETERYQAWNFVSFEKYGTIEWRMQGPMCRRDWRADSNWPGRVAMWMKLCRVLTKHCLKTIIESEGMDLPGPEEQYKVSDLDMVVGPELAYWCMLRRMALANNDGRISALSATGLITD